MDFRTGITINVMLSKALRGKAPDGYKWGAFYKTFREETITPHQLAAHIYNGYSFIPPYKNGRRIEANFNTAYHVAFDFDNISGQHKSQLSEEEAAIAEAKSSIDFFMPTGFFQITSTEQRGGVWIVNWEYGSHSSGLDYLMRDMGIANQFASFAYTTPSHTPETPKSRVVFIIPDGIATAEKTRQLYEAIAAIFQDEGSVTDPACKDPLRLYYGSYHCKVRPNWSALFPSAVDDLIATHKKSIPAQKEYTIAGGTVSLSDANSDDVNRRIQYELGKVATAPDGQKHRILNKTAYLFGGWVASGYLTEVDANESLKNAISRNAGVKSIDAAIKTIETAVLKGKERPATIQIRTKRNITL